MLPVLIHCLIFDFSGGFFFFQSLRTAEEEVEKMAAIAEQEKLKNINMEMQLEALSPPIADPTDSSSVPQLQQALRDKDRCDHGALR